MTMCFIKWSSLLLVFLGHTHFLLFTSPIILEKKLSDLSSIQFSLPLELSLSNVKMYVCLYLFTHFLMVIIL